MLAFEKVDTDIADKDQPLIFKLSNIKCFKLFQFNFAQKNEEKNQLNKIESKGGRNPIDDQLFRQIDFNQDHQSSSTGDNTSSQLLSLKQVLLSSQESSTDIVESYIMKANRNENDERILILKRNDMIIDEKECQVVNFIDISTYRRLEQEKENHAFLKTLNTTVHHEMIVPLQTNV